MFNFLQLAVCGDIVTSNFLRLRCLPSHSLAQLLIQQHSQSFVAIFLRNLPYTTEPNSYNYHSLISTILGTSLRNVMTYPTRTVLTIIKILAFLLPSNHQPLILPNPLVSSYHFYYVTSTPFRTPFLILLRTTLLELPPLYTPHPF